MHTEGGIYKNLNRRGVKKKKNKPKTRQQEEMAVNFKVQLVINMYSSTAGRKTKVLSKLRQKCRSNQIDDTSMTVFQRDLDSYTLHWKESVITMQVNVNFHGNYNNKAL